jgi:ABC-type phosphate/phosphonate transport system substrate-binding protein
MPTKNPIRAAVIAAALLAAGAAQALVLGVTEGVTYRATDPEIAARFEGIADALSKALKQPVTVQVISAYNDVRAALREQRVDLAYIHPAHVALEGVKSGHYRSVAWTAGFTEYKVSFLCREPNPIADWKTVAAKKLVTPDPDSITAVMTRAMLRENGLAPEGVKLLNTRYQDAVPFYVENLFADYGATAAKGVIKSWRDKGGKVCAESRAVPIKQWLVSSKLDAATAATVRDTLLGLAQTEPGKKALAASTYSALVPASADTERVLLGWLGI